MTEEDDVLLASRAGKAVRFEGTDVREFQNRTSIGVRGMRLKDDDEVMSLTILHRSGATPEEREAYLRAAPWKENETDPTLTPERMAELAAKEQFIFTFCANGFGKRSSASEYRRTNRGGQGITNIANIERNGPVVASFPATDKQDLMLVTDQAKLIRTGIATMRVIGRISGGLKLFNLGKNEHVVSAALVEAGDDEGEGEGAVETPTEQG